MGCGGLVGDVEVATDNGFGELDAFCGIGVRVPAVPPVAAEHDGEFCTLGCVLPFDGVRVEGYAQSALGVLVEWNALWDEVAEARHGVEVGFGVVEVDCHDGDIRSKGGFTESGDDNVEVAGWFALWLMLDKGERAGESNK